MVNQKAKKETKGKTVKSSTTASSTATSSGTTTSSTSRQSTIRSSPANSSKTIAGVTITEVSDAVGLGSADSSKCVVVQPDIADSLLTEGRYGAKQVVHYETKSGGSITSEFITHEKSSNIIENRGETITTVGDTVITEVRNPITKYTESEQTSQSSSKFTKFGNADTSGNNIQLVSDIDALHNKQIGSTDTTKQRTSELNKTTSFESGYNQSSSSSSRLVDDKFHLISSDKSNPIIEKLIDHDHNVNSSISSSHNVHTISSTSTEESKYDRNKGNWDGTFTYESSANTTKQSEQKHFDHNKGNWDGTFQTETTKSTEQKKFDKGQWDGTSSYEKNVDGGRISSLSDKTKPTLDDKAYVQKEKNKLLGLDVSDSKTDNVFISSNAHEAFKQVEKIDGHEYDVKYSMDQLQTNKNIGNVSEREFTQNVSYTKDLKSTDSVDLKHITDFDYTIKNSNTGTNRSNIDYSTIIESKNLRSETYAPDNLKIADTVTTYTTKAFDDKSKKYYTVDESIVNEGNIISTESRSNIKSTSKLNNKKSNEISTAKTTNSNKKREATTSSSTAKSSTVTSKNDILNTTNQTTISQQIYDEKLKTWVDVDEKVYKNKRPSLLRYVSQDNDGKYTTIYKKKVFDKKTGSWKVVEEKCYKNNYFNEHIPEVIDDVTNTTTTTYVTKVFDTKTNTWKIVDEQSFTDTKTVVPADIAEEIARDQADIANIITTTEITKVKLFNIFCPKFLFHFFPLNF